MTEQEVVNTIVTALRSAFEGGNPRHVIDWTSVTRGAGVPDDLARRVVARLRVEQSVRLVFGNILQLTDSGYRRYFVQSPECRDTHPDVASIRYPQQFHELCRDLLHAERPRVQTYEGSGGDAGVDAYDTETETIFQFHGPQFPVRKEKLKGYLDKASQHPARHWVLLSKRDLTPKLSAWLDSVRSTYAFTIEVWGPATLNQLLDKHPQTAARYAALSTAKDVPLINVGALVETLSDAKLSAAESEILRNVPDDGIIQLLNSPQAPFLRLGPKILPERKNYDAASAAHYRDALESLQGRGLLRHEAGVLYRLTGRGFDLRKRLVEDQSAK